MKSVEQKIRINLLIVYTVIASLFGGGIYYIYRLSTKLYTQDEQQYNNSRIFNLTNDVISRFYEAQSWGSRYVLSNSSRHLHSYRREIEMCNSKLDSLYMLQEGEDQRDILLNVKELLKRKEILLLSLSKQLKSTDPLQEMKRKLQQEYVSDTIRIVEPSDNQKKELIVRQDTIYSDPDKKSLWKRLGEAFSPQKSEMILRVETIKVDTVVQEVASQDSLIVTIRSIADEAAESYINNMKELERRLYSMIVSDKELSQQISSLLLSLHEQTLNRSLADLSNKEIVLDSAIRGAVIVGLLSMILIMIFLVLIMTDLNRGKEARVSLEKARKESESLMKSRHRLLLAVSHDIKAPLSSILGYLDLMKQDRLFTQRKDWLLSMQSSGNYILSLLTSLLEFSRLEQSSSTIDNKPVDLKSIFDEKANLFTPIAQAKGVSFIYDFQLLDSRYVLSDSLKCRQLISNLLSNAIKFTTHGEVKLSVRESKEGDEYKIIIIVEDSGSGIPKEQQSAIFSPFVRAESAHSIEGSGFGLYVVKGIVDLLKGEIGLSSKVGKGSRFVVTLPITLCKAEQCTIESVDQQPLKSNSLRVLLVEDDPSQMCMATEMLKRLGHEVINCGNRNELELLLEELQSVDLILTDMDLGDFNGQEVLGLIRSSNCGDTPLPIIAVTANDTLSRDEFLKMGFDEFMPKPFTLSSLGMMLSHYNVREERTSLGFDLTTIKEVFDGDMESVSDVVNQFVDVCYDNISMLDKAISYGDFQTAQSLSHKMLPMFKQFSINKWIPLLDKMDKLKGQDGDKSFEDWREQMRIFSRELPELLEKMADSII